MALTKKVPMDKVFGTIRDDYGHMSTIYRRNGVPIVLEEGARVVGFYPDFLAKIRAGNEMRFLDDTLSNADRAAKMLRYDRPFEGALGNDEEVDVSSCAIVKIGQAQFVKARKALQRRAAYHSFARKGLNCATHHYTSADAIGSPTPPVLRHALPNYVAHAIERLVEKRGPVVSEGGGAYPLRIAAGHAGGQRSTGRRSGRTALV
jgi:hypothetical protein